MSDERRAEIEAVAPDEVDAGVAVLRAMLGEMLGTDEEVRDMALGVLLGAARVRDARGDDEAVRLSAADVIEALENGYHPQNPTPMHPADFIVKHFKLDGHENLRDARSPQGDHEPPVLLQDHGPGHRYADGTICPYCAQGEDHEAGIEAAAQAVIASARTRGWRGNDLEAWSLKADARTAIAAYLSRVSAPKADEKQEAR